MHKIAPSLRGTLVRVLEYAGKRRLSRAGLDWLGAGSDCTASRVAFTCADTSAGFACNDPNPFWMGDYECSCAYVHAANGQRARFDNLVAAGCGTETVIATQAHNVSNYDLDRYLDQSSAQKGVVCSAVSSPTDCRV